jgi:L-threonylcarbamoyladenylate synthase
MTDASNRPDWPEVRPYGDAAIAAAAALIGAGQPAAVPTETVYGLAADATDSDAVARIYAAKGRPSFNPLIVHVADLAMAEALGVFGDTERALATVLWPGPLTLVVPRRSDCPVANLATAGLDTIALRVPAHRAMQALIAASGRPLAAPSANASGGISPTRASHVVASLAGRVALVIDDGPCAAGLESTIIRVVDGRVAVLRPGPVTAAQLAEVSGLTVVAAGEGPIVAPGQLASHYAPVKPLRLDATAIAADEWGIGFGALAGDDNLSVRGDAVEAAARLFDALHRADASAKPKIAVAVVPEEGLGAAINDRLRRAAAPPSP